MTEYNTPSLSPAAIPLPEVSFVAPQPASPLGTERNTEKSFSVIALAGIRASSPRLLSQRFRRVNLAMRDSAHDLRVIFLCARSGLTGLSGAGAAEAQGRNPSRPSWHRAAFPPDDLLPETAARAWRTARIPTFRPILPAGALSNDGSSLSPHTVLSGARRTGEPDCAASVAIACRSRAGH
jgi:hypothetical protein